MTITKRTCQVAILSTERDHDIAEEVRNAIARAGHHVLQPYGLPPLAGLDFVLVISPDKEGAGDPTLRTLVSEALEVAGGLPSAQVYIIPLDVGRRFRLEALAHLQHLNLDRPDALLEVVRLIDREGALYWDPRDDQPYETVTINGRTWMKENLRFQSPDSQQYDSLDESTPRYGRLYSFIEARTVCPERWHIPTEADWDALAMSVGQTWKSGSALFEALTEVDRGPFPMVFAGIYEEQPSKAFYEQGRAGYFWGIGAGGESLLYVISIQRVAMKLAESEGNERLFCSVRCVSGEADQLGACTTQELTHDLWELK